MAEDDNQKAHGETDEWGAKARAAAGKASQLETAGNAAEAARFNDLAKTALREQINYEKQAQGLDVTVTQQTKLTDELKDGLNKMRDKREELVHKRDELVARSRMAQAERQVQESVQNVNVTVVPGPPATLTLAPKTDTNTVDDQHCVTATVKDEFGNATPGITVRFSVAGAVNTSGFQTTNASGQAEFCYTGPALPGSDLITAYADTNGDDVKQANEPSDTATKLWVLPSSTPGCKVTYGGRIQAANGDKATFGGNAKATGLRGEEEYQDHGAAADLNVHSLNVLAVVCSADGKSASIFGKATVNGSGSFDYRIDVTDNAEPGAGTDTYRIRLSNGYDSGTQVRNLGSREARDAPRLGGEIRHSAGVPGHLR